MLDMFEGEGAKRAPGDLTLGEVGDLLGMLAPTGSSYIKLFSQEICKAIKEMVPVLVPMTISTIINHSNKNYSNKSNIIAMIITIMALLCT